MQRPGYMASSISSHKLKPLTFDFILNLKVTNALFLPNVWMLFGKSLIIHLPVLQWEALEQLLAKVHARPREWTALSRSNYPQPKGRHLESGTGTIKGDDKIKKGIMVYRSQTLSNCNSESEQAVGNFCKLAQLKGSHWTKSHKKKWDPEPLIGFLASPRGRLDLETS